MAEKKKTKKRRSLAAHLLVTAMAFVVVWFYKLIAMNLGVFNPVKEALSDYSINDYFYKIQALGSQPDTSRAITIVDMTELTDRRQLAEALAQIQDCQPKVVGVDMVFEWPKDDAVGDSMITAVAARDTSTVFSYKLIDDSWDGQQYQETVRSFFADSISQLKQGFVNMPRQLYGGLKRTLRVGTTAEGDSVPSFIKQVADAYAGCSVVPLADRELDINFSPLDFDVVPADQIAEHKDLLADRIVLFGAMREEGDTHVTPQGKIAGVKLLAYGIETLLRQTEIRQVPTWLLWVVSFLVVLLTKLIFDSYGTYVDNRENPFARIFMNASIVKGFVKFLWMTFLMWITYILFCRYNISLDLTWALAAVAFTGSADNFYDAMKSYLISK